MGSLSLFPHSLSSPLKHCHQSPSHSLLTYPIFSHRISSIRIPPKNFYKQSIVLRSSSKDSQFLDENGVVDDMDGYLNQISLEYDSVWDTKPSWCQPWTITLTGVLAITGSWIILHSAAITALVVSLIGAWWYIFLYSYPKAYSAMITERRKQVTSGAEDTFGIRKSK